jgi:IclR family transcriptional regulator, pca regulon regulatory protein
MSLGDEEDRDRPQPFPTLPEARYSHSLERGLAILACFTPEHPALGVTELAERLRMSRPTTHRYVSTFVSLGYLEQDASRKYRLALGAIDLGAALNATGLCRHARPHLEELARHSGNTAEIAVLDGLEILLVEQVRGKGAGRGKAQANVQPGSRLPAYCTGMGKVLLAYLPRALRVQLISEIELIEHGPRTITSKTALCAQLEDVRREGLAIDDEELLDGSFAIAAPVREESGDVIAAVGLMACGGLVDAEDLVDRYEGKLIATAERVSRQIGWRGDEE